MTLASQSLDQVNKANVGEGIQNWGQEQNTEQQNIIDK